MPSLTDIFNSSFLMFLGVFLLVIALLVLYFESRMREQNHKISSMLSLVSSLADELNSVKYAVNQLSMRGGNSQVLFTQRSSEPMQDLAKNNFDSSNENNMKLIEVSDDDTVLESDSESETDSDNDSESSNSESESDSGSNSGLETDLDKNNYSNNLYDNTNSEENIVEIYENQTVKVLRIDEELLNNNLDESSESLNDDDLDDLSDGLSEADINFDEIVNDNEIHKQNENENENDIISNKFQNNTVLLNNLDLKTINISSLEEIKTTEEIDYKKLSLQKLRTIVVEKELISDSSKLKKQELLKLLGIE